MCRNVDLLGSDDSALLQLCANAAPRAGGGAHERVVSATCICVFTHHDVRCGHPQVLLYGVKAHLVPQMHYLMSLGVPAGKLAHLVRARPQV